LHFYAQSHKEELRVKARAAMANGAAIFVTEWGTCNANGNGKVDVLETKKWLKFLEEYNISDANWAISDKSEACSALQPKASVRGHWPVPHGKKHRHHSNESRLFAHHGHRGHHGHHGHHASHHAVVRRGGLTVSGRLVRASLRQWSAIHKVWGAPALRNPSGPAPVPEDGDDDKDDDDDDDEPRANKTRTTTTTSQQDIVSAVAPIARGWALACSACLAIGLSVL